MTKTDREMLEQDAAIDLGIDDSPITTNEESAMTETATNTQTKVDTIDNANQKERERILKLVQAVNDQKPAITPRAILKNFFEMRSLLKALGYTEKTFSTMDAAFDARSSAIPNEPLDMNTASAQKAERRLSNFEQFHAKANHVEMLEGRNRLVIEISSTMTEDFYVLFREALDTLRKERRKSDQWEKARSQLVHVRSGPKALPLAITPANGSGVHIMAEIAEAMESSKHDKVEIRVLDKKVLLNGKDRWVFVEPKLKEGIANIPYFTRDEDGKLHKWLKGKEITA